MLFYSRVRPGLHRFGKISVQSVYDLCAFADCRRDAFVHLPFAILSDEHLALSRAMKLPTFQTSGMTLFKRFTLVIDDGVVKHVFYPVFPPDRSAADVVEWLSRKGS